MDFGARNQLTSFFHDQLSSAIRNQGVQTSELTEYYLANLLADFAHASIDDSPLALQMAEAQSAPTEERAQRLREIGDRSLYVSGFFSDSLHRRLVDVDYYARMGGTAYHLLSGMPARGTAAFARVYAELGQRFRSFVDVLAEVSATRSLSSDDGVLELYERYRRTGSEWMARRLRARGILPKTSDVQ